MKKFTILLVFFFSINYLYSQSIKQGDVYVGVGIGIDFMTNNDVWKVYPAVDVDGSTFLSEVNPFVGFHITKSTAIEFSPSFTIQKTYSKGGYYFYNGSNNYFYVPQNVGLVSIPLIIKIKHHPFGPRSGYSAINGMFLAFGIGGVFIGESYDMYVYTDETKTTRVGYGLSTKTNNIFAPIGQLSVGYEYPATLSFGVETGYKFIPLTLNRETPLVSSWASNFNSVFFNVKMKYTFQ